MGLGEVVVADVVCSYFVPGVLLLPIPTFVVWYDFGPEPDAMVAMALSFLPVVTASKCFRRSRIRRASINREASA